jgi:uncharacterized protein YutE (UPF0331/DUF86 family)
MTKNLIFYSAILIFVLSIFSITSAVNPFDISYPISELGNCVSQEECKVYCDSPDNQAACMDWAAGKGFVSKEEARKVEEINSIGKRPDSYGPGGCQTPGECDAYCRILENLDECLQYSVSIGHISAEEAAKIKEKADKGGPGSCKSKEECDNYCRNPQNAAECMKFVVEEGKITQEEADFMVEMSKKGNIGKPKGPEIEKEKALRVLEEKGGGPGGCKNEQECMAFCNDPSHMDECMNFAAENGLMPAEDIEKVKKMMTIGGPGGCKNEQECDAFCKKEENRDTCFNFAKNSGMLPPEEVMMIEKQMSIIKKLDTQPGPGGCRSKEECSNFCQDPAHMEDCMNFASQTGMMNKERVQSMMGQMQMMQKQMESPKQVMPPGEYGSPPEGFIPSSGQYGPPPGMMGPPPGYTGPMPEGNYMLPPPSGESVPPPPPPPPPSSWNTKSIMGVILGPFLDIIR